MLELEKIRFKMVKIKSRSKEKDPRKKEGPTKFQRPKEQE